MAKTITHKVRNPIYDKNNYPLLEEKRWLDIWSASVSSDGYTITPSNNWVISGNRITEIPVTKIINDGNTHNVTINTPITSNTLAKIDDNGNLVAGPIINSNGDNIKLLNEKGQWTKITKESPINFGVSSDPTDSTVSIISIKHDMITGWTQNQKHYIKLKLNNAENSDILTANEYGHITEVNDINIPLASNTSAGLIPKFTNNATDENKILKIVRNNGNNSITWVNSADLKNDIPVASTWVDINNPGNGLVPGYHWTDTHLNGTFLGLDDSGVSWIAFTDDNYGVPLVSIYDKGVVPKFSNEGQILHIDKNNNNELIPTWGTPKVTLMSEQITHVDLNIDGNALSEEKPTVSAGRLSIPSIYWATDTKVEYQ